MIVDMDVIVGLRGAGKTYRLIEWLTEGHEIPGRPKWSRMIIAAALDPKHYSHQAPPELARKLWQAYPPGLSKLVISAEEAANMRGGYPGVEFAVDDAEHLLPDWLSRLAGQGQLAGLTINGRGASTIYRAGAQEPEGPRPLSVRGRFPV